MNSYTLQLYDSRKSLHVEKVVSFIGEDESGSFGILSGHARMMTVLVFGLARFRRKAESAWEYLAMPGAILYFSDNTLSLACRHYLIDKNYERISRRLVEELVVEEEKLHEVRQSLKRMENALFKRMWEMERRGFSWP